MTKQPAIEKIVVLGKRQEGDKESYWMMGQDQVVHPIIPTNPWYAENLIHVGCKLSEVLYKNYGCSTVVRLTNLLAPIAVDR
jgi:hypothetical protein